MDPLRETPAGDMEQVINVAARLHGADRDRADRERLRQDLIRAAAEIGLTEEHLKKAALEVRGQRRRRRAARGWAITAAVGCLSWGACGLWAVRQAPVVTTPALVAAEAPDLSYSVTLPPPTPEPPGPEGVAVAEDNAVPAAVVTEQPEVTVVPDADELMRQKELQVDRDVALGPAIDSHSDPRAVPAAPLDEPTGDSTH